MLSLFVVHMRKRKNSIMQQPNVIAISDFSAC